jgi:methylated-DNA-[protein]-cysteine S-methyltransferase
MKGAAAMPAHHPVALEATALITTLPTPAGPFTAIVRTADGRPPVVVASGWTDDPDLLLPQVAPGLRPTELRRVARVEGITDAVQAYHRGQLDAIEAIEVETGGGVFFQQAWKVLRTVPAGAPLSYTEFAAASGSPSAVRAAAAACARNPVALFVPCHRVLRGDGSLGGFRWGLPVKRWLLDHESGGAEDQERARATRASS